MHPRTRFTRRPPEYQRSRNRGLLLTGLEAGLRILVGAGIYLIESSQLNGSFYPVIVTPPAGETPAKTESFTCWCEWGRKVHTPWSAGSDVLPCTHQLLVFWYRLPAAVRARLCDQDPNLVAAQLAGQAALIERGGGGEIVIPLSASSWECVQPIGGPRAPSRRDPGPLLLAGSAY
jgi:hypothetical protein